MTDRDRLAADLHEVLRYESWDTFGDAADRLIALGWTRNMVADDLAYAAGREDGLTEALDEERLARALDRVDPDYGPAEGRLLYTPSGQERQASLREWAAAIANAYREARRG